MKLELQNKLYEKYPFLQPSDIPTTPGGFLWDLRVLGLMFDDGWYDLFDEMCSKIQEVLEGTNITIAASESKEKFGGLRFYYFLDTSKNKTDGDMITGVVREIVEEAEEKSLRTCEKCGGIGTLNTVGYVRCLCENCRKEVLQ